MTHSMILDIGDEMKEKETGVSSYALLMCIVTRNVQVPYCVSYLRNLCTTVPLLINGARY
jgi:hypothetical protein